MKAVGARGLWMIPLAIAACCMLLVRYAGIGLLGPTLILMAGGCVAASLYFAFRDVVRAKLDPYHLDTLRELHDRLSLEALDEGTLSSEADEILCVRCGNPYSHRLPVCPNCRHCP